MGPLQGIRVLDLSRVLAGPWATQLLADFGADVVKVESPQGDDTRRWGPPWLADDAGGESAYFLSTNRGKRSITLDLAHPEGARLARALALQSDVLVENFKVGGLGRFGLGYPELAAAHPGLIYCSITGFGQDGPDAARPGYDAMIQALGGLMSITGVADGEPGAGPVKVGVAVADLMAGMYAASAILAALSERHRSGRGQHIDLALLDTQIGWLANQNLNYLLSGEVPRRQGSAHPNIVPYQAFATADGHLMLAVGNDRQFASFCDAAGLGELARQPRFATNAQRVAHRTELVPAVAAALASRSTAHWVAALAAAQVPCGPINSIAEAFAMPQVRHRGLRLELPHPRGTVPGVANPVRYSRSAIEYPRAPPLLGEHTNEVLAERLGLDAEQLRQLQATGALGKLPP
ncbi:MAG: CoA transferase [Gammaproteobacteria bacterium]|nr:CoA transferase [Gammaproteobacteria bacterium]